MGRHARRVVDIEHRARPGTGHAMRRRARDAVGERVRDGQPQHPGAGIRHFAQDPRQLEMAFMKCSPGGFRASPEQLACSPYWLAS